MIVNRKTGQIAYHSLVLTGEEYGGLEFIQNDYDGTPLNRNLTGDEEFIEPRKIPTL